MANCPAARGVSSAPRTRTRELDCYAVRSAAALEPGRNPLERAVELFDSSGSGFAPSNATTRRWKPGGRRWPSPPRTSSTRPASRDWPRSSPPAAIHRAPLTARAESASPPACGGSAACTDYPTRSRLRRHCASQGEGGSHASHQMGAVGATGVGGGGGGCGHRLRCPDHDDEYDY